MNLATGLVFLIGLAIAVFWAVGGSRAGTLAVADLLGCRLLAGFALFFLAFDLPGAWGVLDPGRWVTLRNAAILTLVVAAFAYKWRRRGPTGPLAIAAPAFGQAAAPSFDRPTRIFAAVLAAGFLLIAALLVIGFPRGFEVHAYHLPIAINIFRDGSLRIWDRAYMHTFPANISLWSGFWLQLLPERLVSIVNLPFLALCAFFLYRLCRLAGADPSASGIVAGGITTIPVFGFGAASIGSDVAGVAFVLGAIWLALAEPECFPTWPVLAGAASGVAFGFKSLHLVPATLIGLWILFGPRHSQHADATVRARLGRVIGYALGFSALAGVWLLRNQIELGNPLYPVSLPVVSHLFGFASAPDFQLDARVPAEHEWVTFPWQWAVYPWVEGEYLHQNFKESSGLGAFFATAVPVAWLAWTAMLPCNRWGRGHSEHARVALGLYLCGTATFAVWWLLGDHQPRYVMGGIAELLPLTAVLLACATGWWRRTYAMALALGALLMLAVLVVHLGIEEGSLLMLGRLPSRSEAFEYPPRLDHLPAGATVLDLQDRESHYRLYGAELTNRVISYPRAVELFRDGDVWNLKPQELRRLGIGYVYAEGDPKLVPSCVALAAISRVERNPFNSVPLPAPRTLYRIVDSCPADRH